MTKAQTMIVKIREYEHAGHFIRRGEHGINHGLCWGVWRDGSLVATASTLKSAKRCAEVAATPAQGAAGRK